MTDQSPSPLEARGPVARSAATTAFVWIGIAAAVWLAWQLAQPLLLIFAGLVFAAGLQGGAALIGRVWNGAHGIRLTLVVLLFLSVVVGFFAFAGLTIADQAQELTETIMQQLGRLEAVARDVGFDLGKSGTILGALRSQVGGSVGRITAALGSAVGALGSAVFIVVIGTYFAADPRLYERGVEWLAPAGSRPALATTIAAMSKTLRRWVAGRLATMAIEGSLIFVALTILGLPLAGVLALVSAALAFIPTVGALISGAFIILVGFSVGPTEGLWAVGLFLAVQQREGNVLTPMIERRAVDLPPAVVLAAQLLFGVLFGILGVALADPLVAMVKVALERRSSQAAPP